jgi:hypothetical protein
MRDTMVSMLATSTIDVEFEPQSSQTKDYKICCFSAKARSIKSKEQSLVDSESG